MRLVYFWMLLALCGCIKVQGSGRIVPKRMKDAYNWEQLATTPQKSANGAKYREERHFTNVKNSSRRMFGRHVCVQNKLVMIPVKDMESYCKPTYQSYLRICDKDGTSYCTGYRVVYETAYRTVQRMVAKTESLYICCPGWTQRRISSPDCKKAICREECQNGGICNKPDHCSCLPGWTGKLCHIDVNECSPAKHECQHDCINTPGSYKCSCKEGYTLRPDGRTCEPDEVEITSKNDAELLEKIEALQQRLDALEDWQSSLATAEEEDKRNPRDDRINSLSDQIAILEEKLEEYRRHRLLLQATSTYADMNYPF